MVELYELPDIEQVWVVSSGGRVESGNHGRHVPKDGRIHERYKKDNDLVPPYLEILLQALLERVGYLVELVKLSDSLHGRVVASGARVQALNDGRNIAKDWGVHEGYREKQRVSKSCRSKKG